MKERPIIFKGDMVQAILSGRKTQTRRVVKTDHDIIGEHDDGTLWPWREDAERGGDMWYPCPYGQPGDRLWVREKFSRHMIPDGEPYLYPEDRLRECVDHDYGFHYWADGEPEYGDWERPKPSIHMPRLASRITLEVTGVRVKRLQDISSDDEDAEGIHDAMEDEDTAAGRAFSEAEHYAIAGVPMRYTPERFGVMAFFIDVGMDWDANPWVWVVEFRRISTVADGGEQ